MRGRTAIDLIAQAVNAVERELFSDLDSAEVAMLRDLLTRVRTDIGKACAAAEQPNLSAGTRSAPAWHYWTAAPPDNSRVGSPPSDRRVPGSGAKRMAMG